MKRLMICFFLVAHIACVKTYREKVRTTQVVEPQQSVLYTAKQEWPEDTSEGVTGVGTTAPAQEGDDMEELRVRAEHGALLRIFSTFRGRGVAPGVTEDMFFACVEPYARDIYMRKRILKFDRVEVAVHIKHEEVDKIMECLKQYEAEE
ncbi:MAG: hypothetical protein GF401_01885 [Chitinivibrionales bacterium]|nr:hypothetical protein [Chitinivibrionales bacterium]